MLHDAAAERREGVAAFEQRDDAPGSVAVGERLHLLEALANSGMTFGDRYVMQSSLKDIFVELGSERP